MNSLWGNLFKGERKQMEHLLGVLKDIPIFHDLSNRELSSIEGVLHRRHYNADEVIFSQGSMGAGMYIIINGSVKIIAEPGGKVLSELDDGEFFGEIALLDEVPRSATAVAKTPCTVLGFFQGDLFGLTERNPKLGIKVLLKLSRMIGRRLINANDQVNKLEDELNSIRARKTGG
jgi:CRP-like cAMP-binding protein